MGAGFKPLGHTPLLSLWALPTKALLLAAEAVLGPGRQELLRVCSVEFVAHPLQEEERIVAGSSHSLSIELQGCSSMKHMTIILLNTCLVDQLPWMSETRETFL